MQRSSSDSQQKQETDPGTETRPQRAQGKERRRGHEGGKRRRKETGGADFNVGRYGAIVSMFKAEKEKKK